LRPSVLTTGIVSAGIEISGATGIVVVVVVVDVVVVDDVVLVEVVVVGVLLSPEQAARDRHSPAIITNFFDISLISLRCLTELFQNLTFHGLITQRSQVIH
jgi:hypothetical protein